MDRIKIIKPTHLKELTYPTIFQPSHNLHNFNSHIKTIKNNTEKKKPISYERIYYPQNINTNHNKDYGNNIIWIIIPFSNHLNSSFVKSIRNIINFFIALKE